jgi:hypothetical protein
VITSGERGTRHPVQYGVVIVALGWNALMRLMTVRNQRLPWQVRVTPAHSAMSILISYNLSNINLPGTYIGTHVLPRAISLTHML